MENSRPSETCSMFRRDLKSKKWILPMYLSTPSFDDQEMRKSKGRGKSHCLGLKIDPCDYRVILYCKESVGDVDPSVTLHSSGQPTQMTFQDFLL